ncbi:hypothetical protein [Pedobacter sp. SYSU D00535]|uniref:hypothetical protein n=1 Tax=Pedobacter sp. SYSU D00535 TaxID=2810308 RepID=UPI001A971A0C|nr:hypothetical protein [Pedobacter sp. SYSU D00535]
MKRYRFRMMFFVCTDKKVISPNVHMTNAYQFRETAESVCRTRQASHHKMWEDKTKPVQQESVEAFYLVPEALYEEILKKYVDES